MLSLVSQIAMRNFMISPGCTLPLVTSQPVPPPIRLFVSHSNGAACSRPVPCRSIVPTHVLIVPGVPAQPTEPFTHCVNRPVLFAARFTPTGTFCIVGV